MDDWRIKRVPYDQFGKAQYTRIYGWGWLSPIGLVTLVSGGIGFAVNVKTDDEWLAGMMLTGFLMIWIGIFLNGFSERKSMTLLDAKCLDVQINHIGARKNRSADWAVRALVEYGYNGEIYLSTPMPPGYAAFLSEEAATEFSSYLSGAESIKLYIDPKRPTRSLFHDLNAHRKSSSSQAS